jgi:rhamnose utilization protein RhaD (predicted bifunctional aldolase and dehydrogenase)/NAD(P)-dependent dehydrogenase (short-subunit alcohol dehydrogenase family)
MENAYQQHEAEEFIARHCELPKDLALRIYTSQLIGRETTLVLHGGGNTSVKLSTTNILGQQRSTLFIKGSGANLATIDAGGFTAVDLEYFQGFRELESLSDLEMENQLLAHRDLASALAPSVETLLHAFLPHRFVDHSHADAILILSHQPDATALLRSVLGPKAGILTYLMPGLPLAQQVADCFQNDPNLEAIISVNHGIFTFADDAQTAYTRMIDYVTRAEKYIEEQTRGGIVSASACGAAASSHSVIPGTDRVAQVLRGSCARIAATKDGRPRRFVAELRSSPELLEIAGSDAAGEICCSGVMTPNHLIRTKNHMLYLDRVPEDDAELQAFIDQKVQEYADAYRAYFQRHSETRQGSRQTLDPAPRVALCRGVGLVALGTTRKAARVAADIAEHTFHAKGLAGQLGGYVPLSENHIFDMEYWILEQKKLGDGRAPRLQGQIAFVTGAGGAIGKGIADRLLAAGATVAISDIDEARLKTVHGVLAQSHDDSLIESIVCDVTSHDSIEQALATVSQRMGGIDILVPNAGIAAVATLEDLDPQRFQQVLDVNLMGAFNTIKAAIPAFRRQASGGSIVLISSKNVPDPGASFGAYSASKAGAHQIAKIAALELAQYGVRVNMVNPDAVFGDEAVSSGLWDEIGPDRMKSRGLDPDGLENYYRQRNLLKASVRAEHVGNVVVFLASEQTPTTGASFPVDGGVPSAFPR